MKIFVVEKEFNIRGIIVEPGEYPIKEVDWKNDGFYILYDHNLKIFFANNVFQLYGKVRIKI